MTLRTASNTNSATNRCRVSHRLCADGHRSRADWLWHSDQTELLVAAEIIRLTPEFDDLPGSHADDEDLRHGDLLASGGGRHLGHAIPGGGVRKSKRLDSSH